MAKRTGESLGGGVNDGLADGVINHSVDLLRTAESTRAEVLSLLASLELELVSDLTESDPTAPVRTAYQQRRRDALLKQTRRTIGNTYRTIHRRTRAQLIELAEIESDFIHNLFDDVLEPRVLSTTLSRRELESLATKSLIQGSPAEEWWAEQSRQLQNRFTRQIRMGVAQGEPVDKLVSRIRGRRTNRRQVIQLPDGRSRVVRRYTGGIMDVSKRDATALVRTAVQTHANRVHEETYKANEDLIKGRRALVTLDTRTSPICMARSGAIWDNDGKATEDSPVSEDYPGPPPWHWNCRTVLVPVTYSWDELIARAGGESDLPDVSPGTRASMDGQVPGNQTYPQWLGNQSKARQLEVLGPARYRLWKDGKITLPQLIDPQGRPLSVAELRSRSSSGTRGGRF